MLRLVALLPCYTIEDLELERPEQDADQLLSAWSALWHPALVAASNALPSWLPASSPPSEPAEHLILVPDCCQAQLPDDWLAEAQASGAIVLQNLPNRPAMVAAALQHIEPVPETLDANLTADFLALGYCHLQIELLTRKLRYMSSVDESALQKAALAAAQAALAGDATAARNQLQTAFDRLHDARDYYHPIETHLLDLTLVAPTTFGAALREELAADLPRNLMISASVVEEMASKEPQTLQALREALSRGTAAVIGGEFCESHLPLLDPDAIAAELAQGLVRYEKHLQQRPLVFGRRRYGLTPVLPQILKRCGFTGAFHCTLDDGRFPTATQSRVQWEGIDGTTIEALGCLPLDASRAASFLQLAEKLSDAMSLDTTATIVCAHWPGYTSPWYADLQRIASYGSVLGKFSTITDHFDETSLAGYLVHHKPDEYRSPHLRQQVAAHEPNPISRWVNYFQRRAKLDATATIETLAALCGGATSPAESASQEATDGGAVAGTPSSAPIVPEVDVELDQALQRALLALAPAITGPARADARGLLVINPYNFTQQIPLTPPVACCPAFPLPSPALLSVPALGFAWLDPDASSALPSTPTERRGWFGTKKAKEPPPLAEENLLRNEFCEIYFDPHTGAIRSIFDYSGRGPRLAQQIALRVPQSAEPGADINYSIMSADELRVTSAGPELGEMVCRGRLLDREGQRVAGFQQTTRVWRGSRIIELQIELDIERQPGPNPWESYYAVRFAWKDEMAELHRSMNLANLPTDLQQIESPHFLELRQGKQRTALLPGGLPFHRRLDGRKLDTLLVVQGETARSFRLGIGLDLPHPVSAALGFLAPPCIVPDQPMPPVPSGWLFHLDARNVIATHWELLQSDDSEQRSGHSERSEESGQKRGNILHCAQNDKISVQDDKNSRRLTTAGPVSAFRVRLLETDGRGVQATLRCFRTVRAACKINPPGVPPLELTIDGDRISIPIGPHQLAEVEIILK